jgi:hypothetical protein
MLGIAARGIIRGLARSVCGEMALISPHILGLA